jgi:transposase
VPSTKFLIAIKLFKIDTSEREASKQLGLAYNTVYKIHSLIRSAILTADANASSFSGEIEMDESYFGGRRKGKRGRGAAGKVPVFGILERGGKVTVEVETDVQGETLLELAIKKVKREVSSIPINSGVTMVLSPMGSNIGESITERDSRMVKCTSTELRAFGLSRRNGC